MLNNIKLKFTFPATLIIGTNPELSSKLTEITTLLGHPFTPNPDCLILTPEGDWGIGAIRQIEAFFSKKTYQFPTRLVIITQAESLEIPAQNALLKTIENPGPDCFIILTTRYPHRILVTIRSRCHTFVCPSSAPSASAPVSLTSLAAVDQFLATSPDIRQYFESLLTHYHALLVSEPTQNNSTKIDIIIHCLAMLDHRVDPKLALDYFVLKTIPA